MSLWKPFRHVSRSCRHLSPPGTLFNFPSTTSTAQHYRSKSFKLIGPCCLSPLVPNYSFIISIETQVLVLVLHTPKLLSNAYLCLSHSCLILSQTPTTNHHGICKQYGPLELLHLIRQSVHYDFKRERTQSRSWCSPLSLKCFRCTFYSCYVFIHILYYLHMLLCHFRLSLGTLPKLSHSLQR